MVEILARGLRRRLRTLQLGNVNSVQCREAIARWLELRFKLNLNLNLRSSAFRVLASVNLQLAPPQMDSTRNALDAVFSISDISSVIFDEGGLDPQSLTNAARVCKTFKDPALDALWCTLPGLHPLTSILPPLKDLPNRRPVSDCVSLTLVHSFTDYGTLHQVTTAFILLDYTVFTSYTKRVKKIEMKVQQRSYDEEISRSILRNLLVTRSGCSKIFLSMRELFFVSISTDILFGILMLSGSNLTSIVAGNIQLVEIPSFAMTYNYPVQHNLRTLRLTLGPAQLHGGRKGSKECFEQYLILHSPMFLGCNALSNVRVSPDADMMMGLSRLEQLRTLHLDFNNASESRPTGRLPLSPFPSLQDLNLTVHASLANPAAILHDAHCFARVHVHIQVASYSSFQSQAEIITLLRTILDPIVGAQIRSFRFETLDKSYFPKVMMFFPVVRELVNFHALEMIRFDLGQAVFLSNSDFQDIVVAWPHVRYMSFGAANNTSSPLADLRGLCLLAQCTDLEYAEVLFDATDLPPHVSPNTTLSASPLRSLAVGLSPIANFRQVAHFLKCYFPQLASILCEASDAAESRKYRMYDADDLSIIGELWNAVETRLRA